jgi:phospholipase/carboxylesterase
MPLVAIQLETAPDPTASIIVLHGLGADGNDFVPIAQELDLDAVGPVRFIFPHAKPRPVTVNNGMVMRAWFDVVDFSDRLNNEDETGMRETVAEVEALIQNEIARGIPAERIVVAGFSQGCAIALLTGLRHGARLGGIVGLSGWLPMAQATAEERSAASQDTPIFLAHGRSDGVLDFSLGTGTRDLLQGLGYAVEWHEYGMAHSVCLEEVAHLNQFLLKSLAR